MSRTIRRDREDKKYPEGRKNNKNLWFRCRCYYCTGVEKKALEGKIADRDMELQLKRWYGDEQYQKEWWELTSSEWERRDREFLQEQQNWEDYKNAA